MARRSGLIQDITVSLPVLPVEMDGLRIAHVSDLHVTRWSPRYRRLVDQLAGHRCDLVVLTGDYMTIPGRGQEKLATQALSDLCERVRPTLGFFGVFGNNDSVELRDFVDPLPIRWLHNETAVVEARPGVRIHLLGFRHDRATKPDSVATVLNAGSKVALGPNAPGRGEEPPSGASPTEPQAISVAPRDKSESIGQDDAPARPAVAGKAPSTKRDLRCLLSHAPTMLPTATDLGVDVMFAGHTHGGQIRVPWLGQALYNSTDLPLHLSSGMLRHRDTICLVTRGIGTNGPPVRLFCPPQLPIYRLRRGPMPGRYSDEIEVIQPW